MKIILSFLSLSLILGCSPYSPELGDIPFRCGQEEGAEDTCPTGYTCQDQGPGDKFCIRDGYEEPSDLTPGFQCNKDGQIEPNETPETAFVTGVGDGEQSLNYPNMAICPGQDLDYYTLKVNEGESRIYAEIRFNSANGPLVLQVFDAEGEFLREGTQPPQEVDFRQAQVGNLDPGTYSIVVFSKDGDRNNYSINFEVN